jgi:hypothetical protein
MCQWQKSTITKRTAWLRRRRTLLPTILILGLWTTCFRTKSWSRINLIKFNSLRDIFVMGTTWCFHRAVSIHNNLSWDSWMLCWTSKTISQRSTPSSSIIITALCKTKVHLRWWGKKSLVLDLHAMASTLKAPQGYWISLIRRVAASQHPPTTWETSEDSRIRDSLSLRLYKLILWAVWKAVLRSLASHLQHIQPKITRITWCK